MCTQKFSKNLLEMSLVKAKLSHPLFRMNVMQIEVLEQAVEFLEESNAKLQPELLAAPDARRWLALYARAEKLSSFGVAALSRKVADASEVAKVAGTSMGKAKAVVETGRS